MNTPEYPRTIKNLYVHQQTTVLFSICCFERGVGVYNASDVGTGKTLSTIATFECIGAPKTLILTPAVVVHNFAREFQSQTGITPTIASKSNVKGHVVISSYDIFVRYLDHFEPCELFVADEAHYLKNYQAKRTRSVFTFLRKYNPKRIFLSGTPFVNSTVDAYACFNSCDPVTTGSFQSYALRYAHEETVRIGGGRTVKQYRGAKNKEELMKKITNSFFIRFTKAQVLKTMPELMTITHTLPNTSRFDRALATQALQDFAQGNFDSPSVSSIRRESGLIKAPLVADYVRELLEQKKPTILFAHHLSVIEALAKELSDYSPSIITGETTDRLSQVDNFQNCYTNLIIMNIRAGGVGINLTRAEHVVFAEFDWTYAAQHQAIGRAHRNGNSSELVQAHYLLLDNSLDQIMFDTLMRKKEMDEWVYE